MTRRRFVARHQGGAARPADGKVAPDVSLNIVVDPDDLSNLEVQW